MKYFVFYLLKWKIRASTNTKQTFSLSTFLILISLKFKILLVNYYIYILLKSVYFISINQASSFVCQPIYFDLNFYKCETQKCIDMVIFDIMINNLNGHIMTFPFTLFHVTPIANLFYVGRNPSNFVTFKDRDLIRQLAFFKFRYCVI